MSANDPLLVLYITHHISPDKLEDYMTHLHKVRDQLQQEKDCMSFDVARKIGDPSTVRIVQVWNCSLDTFTKEQLTKDYYLAFMKLRKTLESKEGSVEAFENVGGYHYVRDMSHPKE